MKTWSATDILSQEGRVAVVTGANSGMGWHTVLELARAGSEVILTVRSEDKGRAAVERIGRPLPVHASVGSCWILQASGQCARLRSAWNASLA